MTETVGVTVAIPVLNEGEFIEGCLQAVSTQEIGKHRLQVLVVDGGSTDGTAELARLALDKLGPWGDARVLIGPGSAAGNLNVALERAKASYLVRIDARARVAPDYIGRSLGILGRNAEISVVGGAQVAVPPDDTTTGKAIARALSNRWATGLSRYRRSERSGPADTVWMGVFRTEELRRIGGWRDADADPRNEDYELNQRYRRDGRTIWFDGSLRTCYIPRKTARAIAWQYLSYGRVKGRQWRRCRRVPLRHALLLSSAGAALAVLALLAKQRGRPVAAASLVGAAIVTDTLGAPNRNVEPMVRAKAAALLLVVDASWLTGTFLGLLEDWGDHGPVSTQMETTRRRQRFYL